MDRALFKLHRRTEDTHWWFCARREIIFSFLSGILPPDSQTLVIEAGCCTGGNLRYFGKFYDTAGFDSDPEAVELASRGTSHDRVFLSDNPRDLHEYASRAHAFLLLDILEHIEDDSAFFSSLVDEMREGSYCIITVPANMEIWSRHDVTYGHKRRYDVAGLRRLWAGMPVKCEYISHFNSRLYALIWLTRVMNKLTNSASGEAGTDLSVPSGPVNSILHKIFAGESRKLLERFRKRGGEAYKSGASLIAVLKKI